MDLLLADGSRTSLYRLLEDGRWVRLQLVSDKEISHSEWVRNVTLAPAAKSWPLADFASALVRPDGYLAHVRLAEGARNASTRLAVH
jgi:hypothetical protein